MSKLDQSRNPSRKQESVEEQDLKDSYLVRNVKTRSESEDPSRKQESVEGQDLKDSYLVRNVKTRPESESFKEARECRGTGSERLLSGKECQN